MRGKILKKKKEKKVTKQYHHVNVKHCRPQIWKPTRQQKPKTKCPFFLSSRFHDPSKTQIPSKQFRNKNIWNKNPRATISTTLSRKKKKKNPPAPLSRSPHSHPAPNPKIPPAVTHPSKLLLFKTNHAHQQFPAHPKPTNKTTTALRLKKHKRKSRKQATYTLILQQKDADSSQKGVGRKHIKHKKKEKRKKQQKRG